MLCLTRKPEDTIIIGDDVEVTVLGVKGRQVRLAVSAPKNLPIARKELTGAAKRRAGSSRCR